MKFKLVSGAHLDDSKKKAYEPGDIVESTRELDKIFKNKFIRVEEESAPVSAPVEVPKASVEEEESAPVRTKKIKFKKVSAGKDKWNVIRKDTKKKINAEPVTEEEADSILESLM